jgi:hypothetical protein
MMIATLNTPVCRLECRGLQHAPSIGDCDVRAPPSCRTKFSTITTEVDDEAKVERTQAREIGGESKTLHREERCEQ